MAKYNVGTVVEVLEDFTNLHAPLHKGEQYEIKPNGYSSDIYDFTQTNGERVWGLEASFIDSNPHLLKVVEPENTLAEAEQEDIGGWDREEFESAATKPETVSVDALREAYEYVDHEYLDLDKLIELAKRLS